MVTAQLAEATPAIQAVLLTTAAQAVQDRLAPTGVGGCRVPRRAPGPSPKDTVIIADTRFTPTASTPKALRQPGTLVATWAILSCPREALPLVCHLIFDHLANLQYREQYYLTEIDPDSQVRIEKITCPGEGCDVKLHLRSDQTNADTDRVITFIWEDDEYVWIGEQETHCSGQTFMHPDGEIEECITIIYRARKFDYSGSTGLSILYNAIYYPQVVWTILACELIRRLPAQVGSSRLKTPIFGQTSALQRT